MAKPKKKRDLNVEVMDGVEGGVDGEDEEGERLVLEHFHAKGSGIESACAPESHLEVGSL